jgi:hypothetical protein
MLLWIFVGLFVISSALLITCKLLDRGYQKSKDKYKWWEYDNITPEKRNQLQKEEKIWENRRLTKFVYNHIHYCDLIPLWVIFWISVIVLVVMILILISTYAGLAGWIAMNQARYDYLMTIISNDYFNNDTDLIGNYEFYTQVQSWNEDLAYYKAMHDNFWLDPFIPKECAQFDFIPLGAVS